MMLVRKKLFPMPRKFYLSLLIHAPPALRAISSHVPRKSLQHPPYLPFIEHLEKHPGVHLGPPTIPGRLLVWIEKTPAPEYFHAPLRNLGPGRPRVETRRRPVFYEPDSLFPFPPKISTKQITRLKPAYIERHFGKPFRPGPGLAEPRLGNRSFPTVLAGAPRRLYARR